MLSEEVKRYRELSGDNNPNTPISRIGGYLDGYEKAMEQRTGHWIKEGLVDANGNRNCRCSECGHGDIQAETQIVPYCWWCGAKMQ